MKSSQSRQKILPDLMSAPTCDPNVIRQSGRMPKEKCYVQKLCPLWLRCCFIWPFCQQAENEHCKHIHGRESVSSQTPQDGDATLLK